MADYATTYTILRDKIYFLDLTLTNVNVSTISTAANLIEDSGRTNIMLLNETRFHINDALLNSRKFTRNLLNFKDIRRNGYHIETMNESSKKCLSIISIVFDKKLIMEKLSTFFSGLYRTNIKSIESYVVVNHKFNIPKTFIRWLDRLGHLRFSMMQRIIEHSHGHLLKSQKII